MPADPNASSPKTALIVGAGPGFGGSQSLAASRLPSGSGAQRFAVILGWVMRAGS